MQFLDEEVMSLVTFMKTVVENLERDMEIERNRRREGERERGRRMEREVEEEGMFS